MPYLPEQLPPSLREGTIEAEVYRRVRSTFRGLRDRIERVDPGRARAVVFTKLDEAEGWLYMALSHDDGSKVLRHRHWAVPRYNLGQERYIELAHAFENDFEGLWADLHKVKGSIAMDRALWLIDEAIMWLSDALDHHP